MGHEHSVTGCIELVVNGFEENRTQHCSGLGSVIPILVYCGTKSVHQLMTALLQMEVCWDRHHDFICGLLFIQSLFLCPFLRYLHTLQKAKWWSSKGWCEHPNPQTATLMAMCACQNAFSSVQLPLTVCWIQFWRLVMDLTGGPSPVWKEDSALFYLIGNLKRKEIATVVDLCSLSWLCISLLLSNCHPSNGLIDCLRLEIEMLNTPESNLGLCFVITPSLYILGGFCSQSQKESLVLHPFHVYVSVGVKNLHLLYLTSLTDAYEQLPTRTASI